METIHLVMVLIGNHVVGIVGAKVRQHWICLRIYIEHTLR